MKIGTLLILEINQPDTGENEKFRCKVISKNENYLFIDYPINQQTKKSVLLPENTLFTVTYVGSDQSVYSFHSEIVSKVKLTIPALAISIPEKDKITRIQRREYVRIDTAVDVTVHNSADSFVPFVTVTADLSGGGMSIIIPSGATLTEKAILDIWMVLPMQSGEYQYISTQTKIIRIKTPESNVKTASLKFVSLSNQARQSIIQYCFEKQREARKKELL